MVAPVSTLGVRRECWEYTEYPVSAVAARSYSLLRCAREPSGPRERYGKRVDLETVDRALSFCVSSHCPMRVSSHLLSKSMCESTCRASLGSVRASSHLALLPGPVRPTLTPAQSRLRRVWDLQEELLVAEQALGLRARPRRPLGSVVRHLQRLWHAEERSTIGCASESADACATHRRHARLRNAQGSHPRKGARCAPGAALTAVMLLVVCVCQLSCRVQRVRQLPRRMQFVRRAAP